MRTHTTHGSTAITVAALAIVGLLQPPIATAQVCGGDCNEDRFVTVDELVRGVNIALGTFAIGLCAPFDGNDDGLVTVDEIVVAVVNALNGCPSAATVTPTTAQTVSPPTASPTETADPAATSTQTATPARTISATRPPTPTPTPEVTGPVRVLIATGAPFGAEGRTVTSLGTPILSPAGAVLVVGELTDDAEESHGVLLQLRAGGDSRILLEQGQDIPGVETTVVGIAQPNAKAAGSFALAESDAGGSLLHIDDAGDVVALLGVGAAGDRAGYEVRSYVVPLAGGAAVAEAFAPGSSRALVVASLDPLVPAIRIIGRGDPLSYANDQGEVSDAVVTDTSPNESMMAEGDAGASYVVVDDSTAMFLEFTYDETSGAELTPALVEGNQAPGFPAGTIVSRLDRGPVFGGGDSLRARGFAAFVDGAAGLGFASMITDAEYEALVVVQEGVVVPDTPGALIESPNTPVMGREGAVIRFQRSGPGDASATAVAFADYATGMLRTLVATGDPAPGGGTFAEIEISFALNDTGELVFRAALEGGDAGYYALSTNEPQSSPRRLVATGDIVTLPGGVSGTISALGMIPPTGGLGGEPTAVGTTHFTVGATLDEGDDIQGAVLLVEIGL